MVAPASSATAYSGGMPTTAASSMIGRPQRFRPTSSSSRAMRGPDPRPDRPHRTTGGLRPAVPDEGQVLALPDTEEQRRACRWSGRSPRPTAIGTAPAMADTWETITYTSALTTGTTADTTPKPTEVSSANSSGQPSGHR